MKLPHRRQFLHLAAGAAALPAVSRIARAQAYPSRPVRIIVGFPAGLAADTVARLIAQSLSERLGQQFVIENRPGAASNIAAEAVVRASPDGYSLLKVTQANAINATLYENLGFNFIRDIAPVASIGVAHFVMVVSPSVPAKTVPEFIAYAKANPGKLSMGSTGTGSGGHLFGELFKIDRRAHRSRAISGKFYTRPARRTGAGWISCNRCGDRAHPNRQAARACGDRGDARGRTARYPRLG
jgi:tripartite-type tricarboxylate transporter receptor subunit TctC